MFLCDLLRSSQQNEDVNMWQRRLCTGGDTICYLTFPYPLNTQTETTNRPLLGAMEAIDARVCLYMGLARYLSCSRSSYKMACKEAGS